MGIIVTEGLTKRYGDRVGIRDLDLAVGAGTVFGFLGPNGSGKTTTIRLLIGLLRPTAGAARIFGEDCWGATHRIKAEIGYVPGDLRLYRWLTCDRALGILSSLHGRDLHDAGARLAGEFDLDRGVPVRQMSRGMRQKLGLILALVHEPELVVLDEPSTGLDPLIQDRLFAWLRDMAAAGKTVFFSTHTLSEVEILCDRVAILREGRLVEHDTVERLKQRAPRTVTLRWVRAQDAESTEPPHFLSSLERDGQRWRAGLRGPTLPFIQWCAGQPIEDVSIGSPDLAGLFRRYYQDGTKRP